jgi:ribosomal protein S18 acetylase RimI-like enzyme
MLLDVLKELSELIFECPKEDIQWRLNHMPNAGVVVAMWGGAIVGFKIGYAIGSRKYYSWLGGVHPDFRRQGIAAQMTLKQHKAAKEAGFQTIETVTGRDNAPMLHTNLKAGFHECGRKLSKYGDQLIFLKRL